MGVNEAEGFSRATAGIDVAWLGLRDYAATRDAMLAYTRERDAATRDAIWLLEHPPVYTLGQAGRIEHLHGDVDVPVVRTERGGQITYHGPGQLVAYPLVDLRRRDLKVRTFVALIEQSIVALLATYNLDAVTRAGAPGVYVAHDGEEHKIAAVGLRISAGRSFHGLSLNVAMDLAPYAHIDACGYPGLKSIDMASLGAPVAPGSLEAIGRELAAILARRIVAGSR